MYLKLFRYSEEADTFLIVAQPECEELYVNAPELKILTMPKNDREEKEQADDVKRAVSKVYFFDFSLSKFAYLT